ncbi:hypothetical protein AOLI_G00219300 [Acnodon oligacanthus]
MLPTPYSWRRANAAQEVRTFETLELKEVNGGIERKADEARSAAPKDGVSPRQPSSFDLIISFVEDWITDPSLFRFTSGGNNGRAIHLWPRVAWSTRRYK